MIFIGVTLFASDRFGNRSEAIAPHQGFEPPQDAAREARTTVNHGAVKLHQACARTDAGPGVFRTGDPADPDQRDRTPGRFAEVAQALLGKIA